MKFEKVSRKAVILWELLALAVCGLLLWLVLVVFIPYTWLWYTLLWVLGALWVLTAFLYLPLYYLGIEYALGGEAVVYRKGLFFPHTQILYRDRIAFVTVYHNPLTPLLGISTLVISAAGGSMRIPFLQTSRAKELADELSHG
jgi:membrane protein YdbS with pleckstrin-like domain